MGDYLLVLEVDTPVGLEQKTFPIRQSNPDQPNDVPLRNAERAARLYLTTNRPNRVRLVRKYIQRV
jgi:hypothetical protein